MQLESLLWIRSDEFTVLIPPRRLLRCTLPRLLLFQFHYTSSHLSTSIEFSFFRIFRWRPFQQLINKLHRANKDTRVENIRLTGPIKLFANWCPYKTRESEKGTWPAGAKVRTLSKELCMEATKRRKKVYSVHSRWAPGCVSYTSNFEFPFRSHFRIIRKIS